MNPIVEMLMKLPPEKRQKLADAVTPEVAQIMGELDPQTGQFLSQFADPNYRVAGGEHLTPAASQPKDARSPKGLTIPEDVVMALGTDYFDNLITQVREKKAEQQQEQPAQQAAPVEAPPVQPRNEQPTTSGSVALPQDTGPSRPRPLS